MRRILLVMAVALVMAAMVVVLAVPAFAQANPQASCPGAEHSNQIPPGAAGEFHSTTVPESSVSNGEIAKFSAHTVPGGPDRNTHGVLGPDSVSCSNF
jgi:hypothetical protein